MKRGEGGVRRKAGDLHSTGDQCPRRRPDPPKSWLKGTHSDTSQRCQGSLCLKHEPENEGGTAPEGSWDERFTGNLADVHSPERTLPRAAPQPPGPCPAGRRANPHSHADRSSRRLRGKGPWVGCKDEKKWEQCLHIPSFGFMPQVLSYLVTCIYLLIKNNVYCKTTGRTCFPSTHSDSPSEGIRTGRECHVHDTYLANIDLVPGSTTKAKRKTVHRAGRLLRTHRPILGVRVATATFPSTQTPQERCLGGNGGG